jgi:hypothetical protein
MENAETCGVDWVGEWGNHRPLTSPKHFSDHVEFSNLDGLNDQDSSLRYCSEAHTLHINPHIPFLESPKFLKS